LLNITGTLRSFLPGAIYLKNDYVDHEQDNPSELRGREADE
jgi:hypothetical protein